MPFFFGLCACVLINVSVGFFIVSLLGFGFSYVLCDFYVLCPGKIR